MLKSTLISLAMLAITPLAMADNCNAGLKYCGKSLLKKGRYSDQINQALLVAGQSTDNNHVQNSIFNCLGGASGAIKFEKFCGNGCRDNGSGQNDSCN